ncbi:Kef-type K+ transport system, membrane component KefB [Saccharopolyspora antimicrobica]|uniref:Kef-type K+ transport system, membrane component KefB n=1 Tax=Saccharopolyspora antimicrobica TaxID=455193 RepID=A0A1I5C760_9PSEU|nr:cation:proton antiporter [Saccharopolyspora antimicrobica]RKT88948.1 transporter (CPA2 family) [Saccharopolyspora antimicrobica]SFN82829.1 Kef-type K+ transport system, membrane component KefB [Saccharopolyspora antimicrobica]
MIGRPGRVRTALGVAAGLAALAAMVPLWAATESHAVDSVTRFLIAVAVILVTCQALAALARRFHQPSVLGEMVGGLLLGPSLLGALWPEGGALLFPPPVLEGLDKMAQLGLVVFVFLLGCELRTDRIERKGVVGAAVVGGMALPCAAGMGIVFVTGDLFAGTSDAPVETMLFVGLAMAVTALPVLARLLADLKLERTSIGALSLSAAAIGDGLLWLSLAFLLAGQGASGHGLRIVLLATALVIVTALCVRPLLAVLVRKLGSNQSLAVVLVAGAIGYSALTQAIELHPVVGAFLFGVAVPRDSPAVERISEQLEGFTLIVLLPVFFAGVGLKASVGLLGTSPLAWLVLLVVLVAAVVTKLVGAGGAVRLAGMPAAEALRFGVLMNCRGVTELVVLTIGHEAGLINQLAYTILVLVAVITTAATGPLVRWSMRRSTDFGTALPIPTPPPVGAGTRAEGPRGE